ncbi:hypothetical protein PoB_006134300 [Plakobranchus ocellatus]|uniref:Secreted protein n=1 Tax=Plakobranchus ocellatus TaxID=259542 RepID=A0AAV4CSI8_9GAST|nr:hypothetical protein PoB_006134300 [Plakobranchus ocellatus]
MYVSPGAGRALCCCLSHLLVLGLWFTEIHNSVCAGCHTNARIIIVIVNIGITCHASHTHTHTHITHINEAHHMLLLAAPNQRIIQVHLTSPQQGSSSARVAGPGASCISVKAGANQILGPPEL